MNSYKAEITPFKPYIVCNLNDSIEKIHDKRSYSNKFEIDSIHTIIQHMCIKMPLKAFSYNIITPYFQQKEGFTRKYSKERNAPFIDTIESMQGVERDIVLYSNARTDSNGQIHLQKLNVAFSRAKKCLILIGNFDRLLVSCNEINYNNISVKYFYNIDCNLSNIL